MLFAAFFLLRDSLLRSVVDKKLLAYRHKNPGTTVSVGTAGFRGLSRLVFTDVHLKSADQELAIDLGTCRVHLSPWRLLLGKVRFRLVELDDLHLGLRHQSQSAADVPPPVRRPVPVAPPKGGRPVAYSSQVAKLLDLIFYRTPDHLAIRRLTIDTDLDQVRQTFHVPGLVIQSLHFNTQIEIESATNRWPFDFSGAIDRQKRQLTFRLAPRSRGEGKFLPFIDRQWGLNVGFDSAAVSLKSEGLRHGLLRLVGSMAVSGLTLNHPRIAREEVQLPAAAITFALTVGDSFLELGPPTWVRFNRLACQPYLKLLTRPTRQLTLRLARTKFAADDFFGSLPTGLFRRLAGIQTSGELAYTFDFFVDFAHPESVRLESNLEKVGFRIEHFGQVDFRAVNAPFLYTAYEKDQAVRTFPVGPANPNFRPIDQISPFLKDSVMLSEDGAFFGHRGFLLGPFRDSIALNLRTGRFVRGASTISMQLVKNLYLKRYKTIARKLEEIIITWLIEQNRLIGKERMYEIYLNIIEWGPRVYGAQEAARFYFDKDASDLTLAESLYMASIVPRPKKFIYSFDQDQHLRSWLAAYYRNVSTKMLLRGMITQQEYDSLVPDVRLRGPARLLLRGQEASPEEPPPEEELGELPADDED